MRCIFQNKVNESHIVYLVDISETGHLIANQKDFWAFGFFPIINASKHQAHLMIKLVFFEKFPESIRNKTFFSRF